MRFFSKSGNIAAPKIDRISFGLAKRQKIVLVSIIVTLGFLVSTQLSFFLYLRLYLIVGLSILTYFLSLWALSENMTKLKAVMLLTLPTLYAAAAVLGYFFIVSTILPLRWLTRIPVGILFGISFYLLLLSENIFNVAAIRTIPLYRAAVTAILLFTVITALALIHGIHVKSLPFLFNGVLVSLVSFVLVLPFFWAVEMEQISSKILIYSSVVALLLGELGIGLSFWPIPYNSPIWATAITAVLFILLGIFFDLLRERLIMRDLFLYLGFGVFVFVVLFFTTSWAG